MKLKCEICKKEFRAAKERPRNICPKCMGKLREKSLSYKC